MRREERRRKLQEAVLNTLYPPPPSPQPENEEKPLTESERGINVELINPDDFGESSSSTSEDNYEDDSEPQKLTRSQRKRLRKKKLKEDGRRRGKLVGPLPPPVDHHAAGTLENEPVGVRQNAREEDAITSDKPRDQEKEQEAHNSQKKLKNRRLAKKSAREKLKSSSTEDAGGGQHVKYSGPENCDQDQKLKLN
ncbi:hypothetical protein SLA2020_471100 [Shorea laevis]